MRRRVLCGCWARLAFPRAREKKKEKKHLGICECCSQIIAACLPLVDGWSARDDEHS